VSSDDLLLHSPAQRIRRIPTDTFVNDLKWSGGESLSSTLSILALPHPPSLCQLKITLRADNDFYSQMSEVWSSRSSWPEFMCCSWIKEVSLICQNLSPNFRNSSTVPEVSIQSLCPPLEQNLGSDGELIVAKTGMGSSAALTTSLVGSLLQFFGIIDLKSTSLTQRETDRSVIHNLSQLIHSVAQGKIGSGFDVAAAVYGSQIYRRFSESKIPFDRLINDDPRGELLYSTVRDKSLWDQDILPFHLPNGMDIVMGDVCGGSSSSSMVLVSKRPSLSTISLS
jgi:ERG8-type phosphomevalonate kinase